MYWLGNWKGAVRGVFLFVFVFDKEYRMYFRYNDQMGICTESFIHKEQVPATQKLSNETVQCQRKNGEISHYTKIRES